MNQSQTLFDDARAQQKAGNHEKAEALYRKVLETDPDHAQALHVLGVFSFQAGRNDEAVDFLNRAIAAKPDVPVYHFTLGNIMQAQGKYEDAAASYRRALALKPNYADCLNNLGLILQDQKKYGEAKTCFEKAVQHKPDSADFLSNYGQLLKELGKYEDATGCYERVLSLQPGYWQAHVSIGLMLQEKGRLDEAAAAYRRGLAIAPDSFEILNNLGSVHQAMAKYEDALACYKKALALQPDRADLVSNIAMTLKDLGRLDETMVYCRQALQMAPENPWIYSNILLTMVYASSFSPQEIAETARMFGERIANPLLRKRKFTNDTNLDRKLRIGYVSPDFCENPVRYFIEDLIRLHDRKQFEVFAYSNLVREDDIMARLRKSFDHWRDIYFMDDDAVADLIEKDAIDILIDLAGHTGNNRLMVFARKPAPVQVSWLGFPATTGMKPIDYRITDIYAEPEGMTEHLNTEILWRMPHIFACYRPGDNSVDVIDHPPCERNGYVTFGCFNNFTKVTDPVLSAWADIMKRIPDSRLLLEIRGIDEPVFRQSILERFKSVGLPVDRVILEPRKKSNQYVLYNRIDIALDPFPCNGGTTTMDTLWMGVPFVTLAGEHFVSRMGVTFLTNAGLPDLIAKDVKCYIDIAVDLAKNPEKIRKSREGLREKVAASPLMDQAKFARNIEDAYRGMWQRWCHG